MTPNKQFQPTNSRCARICRLNCGVRRHRMRHLITVATFLITLVVVGFTWFFFSYFLAGHMSTPVEVVVAILGLSLTVALPVYAARAAWRHKEGKSAV